MTDAASAQAHWTIAPAGNCGVHWAMVVVSLTWYHEMISHANLFSLPRLRLLLSLRTEVHGACRTCLICLLHLHRSRADGYVTRASDCEKLCTLTLNNSQASSSPQDNSILEELCKESILASGPPFKRRPSLAPISIIPAVAQAMRTDSSFFFFFCKHVNKQPSAKKMPEKV
jgi:hypothetical protein